MPAPGLPLSQASMVKVNNSPLSSRAVPPKVTHVPEVWVNDVIAVAGSVV